MGRLGTTSLILILGAFLSSAPADEVDWRPARQDMRPAELGVSLGRPMRADAPPSDPGQILDSADVPGPRFMMDLPRFKRIVRAKAEDVVPAHFPTMLETTDDADAPATEKNSKKPASSRKRDEEGQSSKKDDTGATGAQRLAATAPLVDGDCHAIFPQHPTLWTRTCLPPPGSDFGPPLDEDLCPADPPDAGPCRFYASAEYLLWWTRAVNVPPLVTTGTTISQGILGQPGTAILFGGSPIAYGPESGARFNAGGWLDPDRTLAIEGSIFFLGEGTDHFRADSGTYPVLARPIFEVNPGPQMGEFRQLTAFPGLFSGAISVATASRLWGTEVDVRHSGCCGCCCDCNYRIDWLAGLRYLELNDNLSVSERIQFQPEVIANLPNGGSAAVFDSFATRNQFFGPQIGTVIELNHGPWSLDVRGKLAIGNNHETVTINGGQVLLNPQGVVTIFRGGLLALPSNIGRFTHDEFCVVPELGLQMGYHVTDRLRVLCGYNIVFMSNVVRATEQVDRAVDVTQVPNFSAPGAQAAGQFRPAVLFKESSYWAQGLTVGLEWQF
jgi:hypothetical protein